MLSKFQYVPIPRDFALLMGPPDDGTRIFRQEGNHNQMRLWFDSLCKDVGPCVSLGGAAVYAGISRAGVYKRMQSGGLLAFRFHIVGKKKTLFGGEKKLKQFPGSLYSSVRMQSFGGEPKDASGRCVDCHPLRTTFCAFLALNGETTRTAMELMRHSDQKLTTKTYTDAGLLPTGAAIRALPSLLTSQKPGTPKSTPD